MLVGSPFDVCQLVSKKGELAAVRTISKQDFRSRLSQSRVRFILMNIRLNVIFLGLRMRESMRKVRFSQVVIWYTQ
jgi:hypothetical protein